MSEFKEPTRPELPKGWAWEWDDAACVIEAVKRTGNLPPLRIAHSDRGIRSNVNTEWTLADSEPYEVARIVGDYARELWPSNPPAFGVRSAIAKLRAEREWARHQAEVLAAEAAFRRTLAEHVQKSTDPFQISSALVSDECIERACEQLRLGGWPARRRVSPGLHRSILLEEGDEEP